MNQCVWWKSKLGIWIWRKQKNYIFTNTVYIPVSSRKSSHGRMVAFLPRTRLKGVKWRVLAEGRFLNRKLLSVVWFQTLSLSRCCFWLIVLLVRLQGLCLTLSRLPTSRRRFLEVVKKIEQEVTKHSGVVEIWSCLPMGQWSWPMFYVSHAIFVVLSFVGAKVI